jgi:hypothetical protein
VIDSITKQKPKPYAEVVVHPVTPQLQK